MAMISFLSRWMESALERDKGPDLLTQYQRYFFQKYGMKVSTIQGEGRPHILATKADGTRVMIENPITYVELFDALEHLGKDKPISLGDQYATGTQNIGEHGVCGDVRAESLKRHD